MPASYTYPGVYVEEVPSGVRTIAGVSTSDTAFIDTFARGPVGRAVRVTSLDDFERRFGGLHQASEASYAIAQYYLNGGSIAWVVRVGGAAAPVAAGIALDGDAAYYGGGGDLWLQASSPGLWGKAIQVGVDHETADPSTEFNLAIREVRNVGGRLTVVASEVHRNLRLATSGSHARSVEDVLSEESDLVETVAVGLGGIPAATAESVTLPRVLGDAQSAAFRPLGSYVDNNNANVAPSDGGAPTVQTLKDGLKALERLAPDVFNLLCLPASANLEDDEHEEVVTAAAKFCEDHRAFLIVDPPQSVDDLDDLNDWIAGNEFVRHRNAAVYFPRLMMRDPLNELRPREVGPSGTVAGIYARTDGTRGIWKAPAGTDARLFGVDVPARLTDLEQGGLNPKGINVIRTLPIFQNVVWGARTLDGADQQASEWKYIPIRRTALFIEESLYQGIQWAVFEPNDEPLWSQLRLNVGAFMNDLFRQGAFQGSTPAEAYFVKCDGDTTTQSDINRGIVNILVGFAPLKPAEFVVIRLQQIAGQLES